MSHLIELLLKTNKIKLFLFNLLKNYFKKNKKAFNSFLRAFRAELNKIVDDYPSAINYGYRHIDKTMELCSYFNLNINNSIIDVGAANGIISINYAKKYKLAKIYSFEPIQSTYKILFNEIQQYQNIIGINKGLGNQSKTIKINKVKNITSSSIYNIKNEIENKFFSDYLEKNGSESIVLSTLDKEIPADEIINILKIDVQGYELEVLKGGIKTLKHTNIIVLEMQNHELYIGAPKYYALDEYLRKINFILYDIIPSVRKDKKLYEWDSIYINNKLLLK